MADRRAIVVLDGRPAPWSAKVQAKELQSVRLYARLSRERRLDVLPFLLIYPAWVGVVLRAAALGQWESMYLYKLGTAVLMVLHALVLLSGEWSVRLRCMLRYRPAASLREATHALVVPHAFTGTKEIVPLLKKWLEGGGTSVDFDFRKLRFYWDSQEAAFRKLKYPTKLSFGQYRTSSGYGSEPKLQTALERWGPNQFEVPVPRFAALLQEQLLAPFFCFQVFCVGLWALDEYWYYSLFTLFMLVSFECTVVFQRLRNLHDVRRLQAPKQPLQVYRQGRWAKLPGDLIVPGDVVSLLRPEGGEDVVVQADLLLLAGNCIVDEAVLTGESIPQWKNPIGEAAGDEADASEDPPGSRLSLKRDRRHVLFGGTKLLSTTGDRGARLRTPDGGCLAVVLRTGFGTAQGRLMRTILYSTERVTANNWETFLFILFLLVWAVAASGYVLYHGLQDPDRDRFKLALNCVMILTSVIPPELPMELTIAVNASLVALVRKRVFCTEPFRIPLAGKITTCCFDKTGTLTSDHMVLEGIAGSGPRGGAGAPADGDLVADVRALPPEVSRVLACCQSLVQVDKELVGDPVERAGVRATGWAPRHDAVTAAAPSKEVCHILHRYHFSSALKRMSAIVASEGGAPGSAGCWVLTKGAPEVVQGLLAEVPPHFSACYKHYAAQGARVLALAARRLPGDPTPSELRHLPRDAAEAGLAFVGFAVFRSPLKPESEPTLRALRNSGHQLVMITGDAPLTACHTAAQIHIVARPPLILARAGPGAPDAGALGLVWLSPDERRREPFAADAAAAHALAEGHDLCITGDALLALTQRQDEEEAAAAAARGRHGAPAHRAARAHAHAHHAHYSAGVHGPAGLALATYVPLASVFARVTPDHKELVVKTLRAAGLAVLMCGDGTNDVGALKAAHVGVALLTPPPGREGGGGGGARQGGRRGGDGGGAGGAGGAAPGPRGMGGSGAAGGEGHHRRGVHAAPAQLQPAAGARPADSGGGEGEGAPQQPPGPGARMLAEMRRRGKPITPFQERMAKTMDEMQARAAEEALVKPGDASMASPFTAKAASVAPCIDILKQGRCTLVTTVQMFKILGLMCLSTAYSLSVLYLDGIKLGDLQATLSGVLTAGMFFFISNAKPLDPLCAARPHPRIFCAYVFTSLLGQFVVHISFLMFLQRWAHAAMDPAQRQAPDADFSPNLINTVCFLVNFIIQTMTFAVNYVGQPFNTPLSENNLFSASVRWSMLMYILLVVDVVPGLREWFSLVEIPGRMKAAMLGLALAAFLAASAIERVARAAFPAALPPGKGGLRGPSAPAGGGRSKDE